MFFLVGETIDMQDLKDLKRGLSQVLSRGTGPRATVKKRAAYRRARACPSPCLDRGNGVGWRAFFARGERSRGTGPRYGPRRGSPLHAPFGSRCSRTTVSCSSLAHPGNRGNPAPLLLIVEIVEILLNYITHARRQREFTLVIKILQSRSRHRL